MNQYKNDILHFTPNRCPSLKLMFPIDWVRYLILTIFLFNATISAQSPVLSAKRIDGDQLVLSWNDATPFVVEVAPEAHGPWFPTISPLATQSPFICDLVTGPEIDFDITENPFDGGVYLFRLKAASVFDVQTDSGFVGVLEDTNAFVALLVADEECVAYVCNGEEEISEWFRGAITDPTSINLTNPAGAQFQATFSKHTFTGQVTFASGKSHPFTLSPNHGENAGIHRVVDEQAAEQEIEAGWIVNEGDEERGAMRIRSRFSSAVRIRDAIDGSSNTIFLGETAGKLTVKVFRFSTRRSFGRRFSIFSDPSVHF